MITTPGIDQAATFSEGNREPHLAQGLIAGGVLRAARQSAGLSAIELAAAVSLADALIHSWEIGAEPLASVPVPQIDRLKSALRTAGADARLVDDLDPAAWCDLVLEAMIAHEDASCLLADPLASDPAFSELLTWAITGNPPTRYALYCDSCADEAVPVRGRAGARHDVHQCAPAARDSATSPAPG